MTNNFHAIRSNSGVSRSKRRDTIISIGGSTLTISTMVSLLLKRSGREPRTTVPDPSPPAHEFASVPRQVFGDAFHNGLEGAVERAETTWRLTSARHDCRSLGADVELHLDENLQHGDSSPKVGAPSPSAAAMRATRVNNTNRGRCVRNRICTARRNWEDRFSPGWCSPRSHDKRALTM